MEETTPYTQEEITKLNAIRRYEQQPYTTPTNGTTTTEPIATTAELAPSEYSVPTSPTPTPTQVDTAIGEDTWSGATMTEPSIPTPSISGAPTIATGSGGVTTLAAELGAVSATILSGSTVGAGTTFGATMPGVSLRASDTPAAPGTSASPAIGAPVAVAAGVFTVGNVGLVGFPASLAKALGGLGKSNGQG